LFQNVFLVLFGLLNPKKNKTMSNLAQILDQIRFSSFSECKKGGKFERLIKSYLLSESLYHFQEVWLWNEFFAKNDFGGSDLGIDLVAKTDKGDFWAIQCKFYQEGGNISKHDLDSFLSTSSREFTNENYQRQKFAVRLWVDTTGENFGRNAEETTKNQDIPLQKIGLHDLEKANVDWQKLYEGLSGKEVLLPKKQIREHQQIALDKVLAGFQTADRGKLIMACGTGKTFTSLKIAEQQTIPKK